MSRSMQPHRNRNGTLANLSANIENMIMVPFQSNSNIHSFAIHTLHKRLWATPDAENEKKNRHAFFFYL